MRRVVDQQQAGLDVDQRDGVAAIPRIAVGVAVRMIDAVVEQQDETLVRIVIVLQPILVEAVARTQSRYSTSQS